jgi:hypothetical protein
MIIFVGLALPSRADVPASTKRVQRSVHFEVGKQIEQGSDELRVPLTIILSREQSDQDDIVLVLEGPFPGHILAPMAPGLTPASWQTTLMLDPIVPTAAETQESGFWIDVSFARLEEMKLRRFLKRSVYVALGRTDTVCEADQQSRKDAAQPEPPWWEAQPEIPAMVEEPITETNLVGIPRKEGSIEYWSEVTQRIAQRWKHRNRRGLWDRATLNPRIRFRLYATGMAQAVYLERTSGNLYVDEAALRSVVDTQPFAPFPPDIDRCFLDIQADLHIKPRR